MQRPRPRRRAGFTLIELLVVMSIIGLLMGIAGVAASYALTAARNSSTKSALLTIDKLLQARKGGIDRYILDSDHRVQKSRGLFGGLSIYIGVPEYIPRGTAMWDEFNRLAKSNYNGRNQERLELLALIARKEFERSVMPQTFAEAGITPPANHRPETESAECLYKFLFVDDWLDGEARAFGGLTIRDTDADGLPEVVDGFGQPLRFYRWPTRLFRPQPAGSEAAPQTNVSGPATVVDRYAPDGYWMLYLCDGLSATREMLGQDNDDGLARILTAVEAADPLTGDAAAFERAFHTVETYHRPFAVSAGEDGLLGLHEPNATGVFGNLAQPNFEARPAIADDISTFNLW